MGLRVGWRTAAAHEYCNDDRRSTQHGPDLHFGFPDLFAVAERYPADFKHSLRGD
jgi:hypothetical protein